MSCLQRSRWRPSSPVHRYSHLWRLVCSRMMSRMLQTDHGMEMAQLTISCRPCSHVVYVSGARFLDTVHIQMSGTLAK